MKESNTKKLIKKYLDEANKAEKILKTIEQFKEAHKEVFDTLEGLEKALELYETEKERIRIELADEMQKEEIKTESIERFNFTYVAETVKRNFNLKLFLKNFGPKTKTYKTYIKESNVSHYVKVKENKAYHGKDE